MVKRAKIQQDDDDESIDSFYDEYRGKLVIDKHAMDDMWLEQPAIVQEIGERVALEISRRDEAKDALADVSAVVDGEVRELHADDDKKPTETAIKNEVKQDSRVQKAQRRLRTLELNVAKLGTLANSFHVRRYALQSLTDLWSAGYYTSNSGASKAAREATHGTTRKAMQAERTRRRDKDEEE